MMRRSNACKPWLLAFLPSLSSLDVDLQVKHVEFDTRPCAMISAWCGSPLTSFTCRVDVEPLCLKKHYFLKSRSVSLRFLLVRCTPLLFAFSQNMSAKGLIEKDDLQARSRRKTTCAPVACQLALFTSLRSIPVKHKQHHSHYSH